MVGAYVGFDDTDGRVGLRKDEGGVSFMGFSYFVILIDFCSYVSDTY